MQRYARQTQAAGQTHVVSRRILRLGLLAAGLAGVLAMGGCKWLTEPRVKSPISGEEVTQSELRAEHAAAQERATAKAKADAEAAAAEAQRKAEALAAEDRAERERIEAEARAAKREFDAAVAGADLASQQALLELRSRFDSRADEIAALAAEQDREREYKASLIRADLSQTLASITSGTQSALDELKAQVSRADVRFAAIDERNALIDQGVSAVSPIAALALGSVPGVGGVLTGLWGLASGRAAKRQADRERNERAEDAKKFEAARKREDELWEEAQRAKEAEVTKRDANYDAGMLQSAMAQVMGMLAQLPAMQINTQRTQTTQTTAAPQPAAPVGAAGA